MKLIATVLFLATAAVAQVGPIAENYPPNAPQAPGALVVHKLNDIRYVRAVFYPAEKLENVFYQVRIVRRGDDLKGIEYWTPVESGPIEVFEGRVPKTWGDDFKFEVWMRKQSEGVVTKAETTITLAPMTTLVKYPPHTIAMTGGVLQARGFKSRPIVYVSGHGVVNDSKWFTFSGDTVQVNIGAVPEFVTFCSEGECDTYFLPAANATIQVF